MVDARVSVKPAKHVNLEQEAARFSRFEVQEDAHRISQGSSAGLIID